MTTNTDKELTRLDIQALSSRENLIAFFANLGYHTDKCMTQTCSAMGITAETLQRQIKSIERVALEDSGAEPLDVYLIELTSVTMSATQGLARALRNRIGNYLLVLTDDYECIDFVLLERSLPISSGPMAIKQVSVRPRILTVNRRDPTQVQLRVLRRFTLTEADSDVQYEKLISAYSVAEWAEPLFNNRALLSDYYLNSRLPERPEWRDHPEVAYHGLRQLVASTRQRLVSDDRGKTRELFIEPALALLGFKTAVGSSPRCYNLMSSHEDITPIAMCLAYAWNRNLDARDETRDSESPDENPAASVVTLLESGETPWVILTNGKIWRLYSAKTHSKATNYYEIDLDETLAMEDPGFAFRYFWLLFRAEAFIPRGINRDVESRIKSFLDELLEESERYAKGLGERLKNRIFEDIFPHFAEGFIEYLRSQPPMTGFQQEVLWPMAQQLALKQEPNEEFRRRVFQGTLTFLYRLLFLFYAESRGLLPVKEERGYWEYSLTRMKEEIAEKAGKIIDEAPQKLRSAYHADSSTLYDRMVNLFKIIDKGSREMNVPFYNGGLFLTQPDPNDHSPEAENAWFLLANKIPDRYLALGLDLLARDVDEKRQDLVAIDYKSLGVRHLGSIYEGLLEFKIRIAQEKMAVVQGKKTEEVIRYSEAVKTGRKVLTKGRGHHAEELVYPARKVYLENDRRERKVSGSYYTPDYIVKYIVQNTVGPILAEKIKALTTRIRQTEQRFHASIQRKQVIEKVAPDYPALLMDIAGDVMRDLFDVKILDPAMGSGHFLVECVDFITDRLVEFISHFRFLSYFFEGTRHTILNEMERQGVTIDPTRLTDVNLLKRHVLKRCIYGVDLNPMAVELAKVSLWLDCFTIGAPLSFLDHHLKCGNSLIGTTVQEVEAELAAQKRGHSGTLWGGPFQGLLSGTSTMLDLTRTPDVTIEEAELSKKLFKSFEEGMAPYKAALDIWVSRYFGNKLAQEYLTLIGQNYVEEIRSGGKGLSPEYREVISKAKLISDDRRIFHWDLEFPEAFVDLERKDWKLEGQQGFDAIIGNPPYGYRTFDEITSFTDNKYKPESDNIAEIFLYNASKLTKSSGALGMLTPKQLTYTPTWSKIRSHLLERFNCPYTVADVTEAFPEVLLEQTALVFQGFEFDRTSVYLTGDDGQLILAGSVKKSLFTDVLWPLYVYDKYESELQKIWDCSIPLCELIQVYHGLKNIRPFTNYSEGEVILRGDNIGRYECNDDLLRLPSKHITSSDRSRHKGPKLVFQQIVAHVTKPFPRIILMGYLDESDSIIFETLNTFRLKDKPTEIVDIGYLLTIMNSRFFSWYVHRFRYNLSVRTMMFRVGYVEDLPIRKISFSTSLPERNELNKKLVSLYNVSQFENILKEIGLLLPGKNDVVHDLLAHLSKEMINLNKHKQAGKKQFLGWLEGALKINPNRQSNAGLDALTGKSRLRNFLGDYQKNEAELSYEELEDILFKNRSRLGVSLSDTHFTTRLRMEYDKSLALLLPIKDRLARTDKLIDQVVCKLYSLTEDEIAVIEGDKTVEGEIQVSSRRETGRPESIARESDPRVLAEILDELLRLGPVNSRQLSGSLRSRVGVRLAPAEEGSAQRGTKLGPSEADTIKREFGFLGWINRAETLWVLTDEGKSLAERHLIASPTEFARQICIANDRKNQQVVSRLLARLWELNPEQQGSVIIPQPVSGNIPENLTDLRDWLLPLIPKWLDGLEKQMKGFSASVPPEDIVAQAEKSLGERWEKMKPGDQRKRLQEVIAERFTDLMFSHIISPADVEIWQSRMDWAGLTLTARNLPSVAGQVWFPVGAFREPDAADFTAIKGLEYQGRTYHCYTPTNSEFEKLFGETLYEGYLQRQQQEQVEYVSLMTVRDWVCFRLRIGNPHFEYLLQRMFPKAVQGELPYSMALEVDITPAEKSRLRGVVPVVIDGTTRYIISMRYR